MQNHTPAGLRSWRTPLGIGLALLVFALPGCGTGGSDDSAKDVESTPESAPAPAPAARPKKEPAPPRSTLARSSGQPTVRGSLRIMPGMLDIGVIPPNSVHPLEFALSNTGTSDLEVVLTKPTCLCTAMDDLAGTIISPGKSVTLNATFTAPTELGEKRAKVQVVFRQDGAEDRALIGFGGTIAMELQPEPPYVEALKGVTAGVITVASIDDRPFSVISTDGERPVFADGFDPASDAPRSSYEVRWNVPDRSLDDCEGMRLWWIVETDDEVCPIIPVRVRHNCTGSRSDMLRRRRGWIFSEQIVALGAVEAGAPVVASVKLTEMAATGGSGSAQITGVESETGGCDVDLLSTERVGKDYVMCHIRVTPKAASRGMMYDKVRFNSPTGSHAIAFVSKVE
jgi:hypothetical protein